ncbi:MAG: hypothetical protein M3Z92_04790 [Bacteroidota bacterium]|nr:hypothetical protein [Bacteroidota bacterium]MDQ6902680.1 hypothetical protein [Bacteroidota bacterium]
MPVQFKMKITREILEISKECGADNDLETTGKNCAIAVCLRDLFPDVFVTGYHIYPFGADRSNSFNDLKIEMPKVAQDFIRVFDSLCAMPRVRLTLPEFEFEISISDEIISQINIDEVRDIKYHPLTA